MICVGALLITKDYKVKDQPFKYFISDSKSWSWRKSIYDEYKGNREKDTTIDWDFIFSVYSEFKNAATQAFVAEQFLPIPKVTPKAGSKKADFIFEPAKEVLIAELMPKILNTQLFKAVLDGNASEHGARMTAMDKASENANELLKSLKISYNRARQAAITTELTEIVSGAAALQG